MPNRTFVEIPEEEQAQMLAALRRARYGSLLALHILLLSAAGRTPTDIAAVLFRPHCSVYRTLRASREGCRGWRSNSDGQRLPSVCRTGCCPYSGRSRLVLRQAPPRAYGRCQHMLERCHASPDPPGRTSPDSLRGHRGAMGP
jgi:Homeodomain-like domain-containing protein